MSSVLFVKIKNQKFIYTQNAKQKTFMNSFNNPKYFQKKIKKFNQ